MKIILATSLTLLLGIGSAVAGAGAPTPEGSQTPPSSGRPSAALDDAACQDLWKMAAPSGDMLAKDKATPFVVNYEMVDTDKNGSISQAEFKTGCSAGWIQKPDASTSNDMKGTKQ